MNWYVFLAERVGLSLGTRGGESKVSELIILFCRKGWFFLGYETRR